MSQTLRWGLLGATSYIAGHVASAIIATAGGRLEAVASRPGSVDRATDLADGWGARLSPGYTELVGDPAVDVVYVALPNSLHREWTLRSLAAGKHVLVEKPLATTVADCREVRAAAHRYGRHVMEGFMYRFHPQFGLAGQLVAEGTIGDLRVVRASFAYPIVAGSGNIRLDPTLGGGATWDVGCYAVDAVCAFFGGPPRSVESRMVPRPDAPVEGTVVATLDYGDGRYGLIDYSIDYGPQALVALQGTAGSVTVHNAWAFGGQPAAVTTRTLNGDRTEMIDPTDHYRAEVAAFRDSVLNGTAPQRSLAESELVIETCARLLESVRANAAESALSP